MKRQKTLQFKKKVTISDFNDLMEKDSETTSLFTNHQGINRKDSNAMDIAR